MKNITYLLGAGASCQALPLVNEISGRLGSMINQLSQEQFQLPTKKFRNIPSSMTQRDWQRNLIFLLTTLRDTLEKSKCTSIDVLAKRFYIKNQKQTIVSYGLIMLFIWEQYINHPDTRYDTFFASILEPDLKLPNKIKICSWNYDLQLELAFRNFVDDLVPIDDVQQHLDVTHKFQVKSVRSGFNVFKLNGTAAMRDKNNKYIFFPEFTCSGLRIETIQEVVYYYAKYLSESFDTNLFFAWDKTIIEEKQYSNVIGQISETNVLVIIGYSFPFFNRLVDRAILGNLKSIEKVYIQDKNPKGVSERLEAIFNHNAIPEMIFKENVDQFFIPNEF